MWIFSLIGLSASVVYRAYANGRTKNRASIRTRRLSPAAAVAIMASVTVLNVALLTLVNDRRPPSSIVTLRGPFSPNTARQRRRIINNIDAWSLTCDRAGRLNLRHSALLQLYVCCETASCQVGITSVNSQQRLEHIAALKRRLQILRPKFVAALQAMDYETALAAQMEIDHVQAKLNSRQRHKNHVSLIARQHFDATHLGRRERALMMICKAGKSGAPIGQDRGFESSSLGEESLTGVRTFIGANTFQHGRLHSRRLDPR